MTHAHWHARGSGIMAACALAVLAGPAAGHEAPAGWTYDAYCCNGSTVTGDCQRIASARVRPVAGGWAVHLGPGDHRLVTRPHDYFKGHQETRKSQDGDFHACLFPSEDTLRCLYVPPMGF